MTLTNSKKKKMGYNEAEVKNMTAVEETFEFLKKAGTYFLATEEGNQPRVRPFASYDIIDGKLYFQTGKPKNVFKEMMVNPHIEISAVNGNDWIRISGEAVLDDRVSSRKKLLDDMPFLRKMYNENDGKCAVFFLKNATVTFYSFTNKPKTIVL
jgi:uncharacterized pyridoxamine 5'-phosphate oxidase family protein